MDSGRSSARPLISAHARMPSFVLARLSYGAPGQPGQVGQQDRGG